MVYEENLGKLRRTFESFFERILTEEELVIEPVCQLMHILNHFRFQIGSLLYDVSKERELTNLDLENMQTHAIAAEIYLRCLQIPEFRQAESSNEHGYYPDLAMELAPENYVLAAVKRLAKEFPSRLG